MARGQFVDPSKGTVTFGKYAREWMGAANLQPRTRETYESQLWAILEKFERVPLGRLEPPRSASGTPSLLRSGRHANTVAKIYRLFRSILATAVEDGLIRSEPVHIKRASNEVIIERPALTPEDVPQGCQRDRAAVLALVWTAALTGLRFGELTGLARRHVNLGRARWRSSARSASCVARAHRSAPRRRPRPTGW